LPARQDFRCGLADHKESITMSGERKNPLAVGQISPSAALQTLPDINFALRFAPGRMN